MQLLASRMPGELLVLTSALALNSKTHVIVLQASDTNHDNGVGMLTRVSWYELGKCCLSQSISAYMCTLLIGAARG